MGLDVYTSSTVHPKNGFCQFRLPFLMSKVQDGSACIRDVILIFVTKFYFTTSNTLVPPTAQSWSVSWFYGKVKDSFTGHTFLPIFTKIGTEDFQAKPHKTYQMKSGFLKAFARHSQSKSDVNPSNNDRGCLCMQLLNFMVKSLKIWHTNQGHFLVSCHQVSCNSKVLNILEET